MTANVFDQDRAEAHMRQAASLLADAFEAGRAEALADHVCPSVPVWRATTADEIRKGWEVRARYAGDGEPIAWGVACERTPGGVWVDSEGFPLTSGRWTIETTAPLPEPEPWPDELVGGVAMCIDRDEAAWWTGEAVAILDHLAAEGLIERPGGER